eukprot:Nitzschia sp. Nitz4//scaffold142_size57810//3059//4073//NITZ4_006490-RA/size57810-snap-gene-0.65-mRNA-1//-1//CDS//3329536373//6293//frame0
MVTTHDVILSAEDLLLVGLRWINSNWSEDKQKKLGAKLTKQRFVSSFGTTPETLARIYTDLQSGSFLTKKLDHYYLFMTLFWLKNNMAIPLIALIFDSSERTVGTYIWTYAKAIQALKEKKISLNETLEGEEIFVLTVDGVHFRTRECRIEPNKNWFSHKSHGPGFLSYELGIAIHDNKLCWINGLFRASVHDKTIFSSSEGDYDNAITKFRSPEGLQKQIPEGKRLLGDRGGYRAFPDMVSTRNRQDERKVKEFKSRALCRHETFNGRIKNWKVLRERWEYDLKKHVIAMEAVCVLEQYRMECDNPLFEV